MYTLYIVFGFVVTNVNRSFGSDNRIDETLLQTLSKLYSILNACARITWGFILDKYSLFYPYLVLCSVQIGCSACYYFSAQNGVTFLIATLVAVLGYAGQATMFPPFVGKIFGMKNSVTMLGILGIFNGVSSLLGPVIQTFIITDVTDYLIVFLIACGLTVVSLVLLFFVNDKEFAYKDEGVDNHFEQDDNLIPESMRTTVKE